MRAYPVLEGKIAERGIMKKAIATRLGIPYRTFANRLNGTSEFRWSEVQTMQRVFFPDMSMEESQRIGYPRYYLYSSHRAGAVAQDIVFVVPPCACLHVIQSTSLCANAHIAVSIRIPHSMFLSRAFFCFAFSRTVFLSAILPLHYFTLIIHFQFRFFTLYYILCRVLTVVICKKHRE